MSASRVPDHPRFVGVLGAACVAVPSPETLAPPPKPTRPTRAAGQPPASSGPREPVSGATIEAFIERRISSVRNTPENEKHYTLRDASFALGGIQDQAGFSDAEASRWLLDALPSADDWQHAENTIARGLADGRDRPIDLTKWSVDHALTQEEWETGRPPVGETIAAATQAEAAEAARGSSFPGDFVGKPLLPLLDIDTSRQYVNIDMLCCTSTKRPRTGVSHRSEA